MKKFPNLLFTVLVVSSLMVTSALAASPPGEKEAPGQPFDHPTDDTSYSRDMRDDEILAKAKPTDNGNAQYISGGVADSGMRAIDAEESVYNLKLLFVAKPNGEYLANVVVNITDSNGDNVLDTTTKGPVLLVKMKPGTYTVNATRASGFKLTQKIKTTEDHLSSYVLHYPETKK